MILHNAIDDRTLRGLIRKGVVSIAGNRKLKIYGMLSCFSGKRMRRGHRIFFSSRQEAINYAYRPCGHCMKDEYKIWKGHRIVHTRDPYLRSVPSILGVYRNDYHTTRLPSEM